MTKLELIILSITVSLAIITGATIHVLLPGAVGCIFIPILIMALGATVLGIIDYEKNKDLLS